MLRGASFSLYPGEIVALLVAPTGAANLRCCTRRPAGAAGCAARYCSTAALRQLTRATHANQPAAGFVYQFHNLLPEFSALENVVLPRPKLYIRTSTAA